MEVNILKWAVTVYPKLLKASWFQSLSLGGKRPINFKKMTNVSLGNCSKVTMGLTWIWCSFSNKTLVSIPRMLQMSNPGNRVSDRVSVPWEMHRHWRKRTGETAQQLAAQTAFPKDRDPRIPHLHWVSHGCLSNSSWGTAIQHLWPPQTHTHALIPT